MTTDPTITEVHRSRKNAEANFVRVARALPASLAQREETLLDEFNDSDEAPLERLQRLYAFMEELYRYVDKHTPCQRGCDACCHYAVSVSALEVEFIESRTSHRRELALKDINQPHGKPCPFLQDGECGIYSVRPFLCRRQVTLDVDARWCAVNMSHDIELPQLNFSEVISVYESIVGDDGSQQADIRSWFGERDQPGNVEPVYEC